MYMYVYTCFPIQFSLFTKYYNFIPPVLQKPPTSQPGNKFFQNLNIILQSYFNNVVPYLHAKIYPTHLDQFIFSIVMFVSFMFKYYPTPIVPFYSHILLTGPIFSA
jgi:hypothetical protein